MVAYKGKTAGNLRQYIKSKPDKWGFKLFARASQDGFNHDLILYQGQTTLEAHGVPLTPEQQVMGVTSQTVSVLASTMSSSSPKTIFADHYFSGLEIVEQEQPGTTGLAMLHSGPSKRWRRRLSLVVPVTTPPVMM